ncbi:hypothetical protein B0T17DRAFT_509912 [Bombardia bombarda]|uniref:Uncharacterized protein n=1 Tax=Bombardia bombarda TaxID=252184 RepID=A0AA39WMX9_9PEZI|nr:hypothetical protein B0T17DRAFT_509912 [Bombardia bombarda]
MLSGLHLSTLLLFTSSSYPVNAHLSVVPDSVSTTRGHLAVDEGASLTTWRDPVPGFKALFGLNDRVLDIGKRDCLSNGSNFCFGNNVNFCPSCGTCCVDGQYCCSSGGICCAAGCCSSGQICSDGRCLFLVTTITVTSTIYETVTDIATQRATVLIAEIDTSTVLSAIEATLSSAATQTNIVWETATAIAKRTITGKEQQPVRNVDDDLQNSPYFRAQGVKTSSLKAPGHRRQASDTDSGIASTSTVTEYTTQTTATRSLTSTTVTAFTTSWIISTVYATVTRVLNAQTTIDLTSTLTITSYQPSTLLYTTTVSPVWSITPTTSAESTTIPSTSSSPLPTIAPVNPSPTALSTPAIIGISISGAVVATIIIALLVFCLRHHSRWSPSLNKDQNFTTTHDISTRQPTLPTLSLPHFMPSAPAHHAAQFQPPTDFNNNPSQQNPATSHHRNNSGLTTLIGTPNPNDKGDGDTITPVVAIVEVQGSAAPEWFEVDGSSPLEQPGPAIPPSSSLSSSSDTSSHSPRPQFHHNHHRQNSYQPGHHHHRQDSQSRGYYQVLGQSFSSQVGELDAASSASPHHHQQRQQQQQQQ